MTPTDILKIIAIELAVLTGLVAAFGTLVSTL